MRKFRICLVSIFLLIGFAGCGQKMSVYENFSQGIRIQYPPEWTKMEHNEGGAVVAFLSPKDNALDPFQENVNVVIQDLSRNPMDFHKYTRLAVGQLTAVFKDKAEILENVDTRLGGRQAHRFIYEVKAEHRSLQIMHVWLLERETVYMVTYTAQKDNYGKYLGQVKAMLKSFELLK